MMLGLGLGLTMQRIGGAAGAPTRRNLLTYTEDMTNGVWLGVGASATDAETLTEAATENRHIIYRELSGGPAGGTELSLSVEVEYTNCRYVVLSFQRNGTDPAAYFDLVGGTVTDQNNGTGAISPVSAGVYRISVTGSPIDGFGGLIYPQLGLSDRADDSTGSFIAQMPSYVGTSRTVKARKWQLEAGPATAYQAVTGATWP